MAIRTIEPTTTTPQTAPTPWQRAAYKLLATRPDDHGALVARLATAVVMFPHGAQKVLGIWGGHGLSGTIGYFGSALGIPAPLAVVAILTEFLAPIALAFGFLSRAAALGVFAIMTVATLMVHLPNGFFMNWAGDQAGEGFEYHIAVAALALIVMIRGGGTASVDRALADRVAR